MQRWECSNKGGVCAHTRDEKCYYSLSTMWSRTLELRQCLFLTCWPCVSSISTGQHACLIWFVARGSRQLLSGTTLPIQTHCSSPYVGSNPRPVWLPTPSRVKAPNCQIETITPPAQWDCFRHYSSMNIQPCQKARHKAVKESWNCKLHRGNKNSMGQ